MNNNKVYEDDNWIIEIINDTEYNPQIRISSFKYGHFVEDLELSRQLFEDDELMSEVKDLIYK